MNDKLNFLALNLGLDQMYATIAIEQYTADVEEGLDTKYALHSAMSFLCDIYNNEL